MPPDDDDEQELKAAFAELHQRARADAPPFDAMRQRALSAAGHRPSTRRTSTARLFLWGTPAAACAAAVLLWMSGYFTSTTPPDPGRASSAQHVEQLLNSIEQHLETDEAPSSAFYPTDALLTQSNTAPPSP